jgi:hypothetical protein
MRTRSIRRGSGHGTSEKWFGAFEEAGAAGVEGVSFAQVEERDLEAWRAGGVNEAEHRPGLCAAALRLRKGMIRLAVVT